MGAVTGKGGTFTYDGGSVALIDNWTLDVDSSMHDITSFTTSLAQWREFIDGLSGFTGAASGTFDSASTGQNDMIVNTITPAKVTAIFELDQTAGGKFTGSVFVSSLSIGTDIDAPVDISWSLQGTGALTFTTST